MSIKSATEPSTHENHNTEMEPVSPSTLPPPIEDPAKKKKDAEEAPKVTLGTLFQYADGLDRTLMVIGAITAFLAGAGMPAFSEIFGRIINDLIFATPAKMEEKMRDAALLMTYVGIVVFFLNCIHVMFWMLSAMRQISRIRMRFFASVLRQDIGWHDEHKPGELTARMDGDTRVVQNGINDKFSNGIFQFGMFTFGFGFGFYRSWELTLVMLGTLPIIAGVGGMMSKVMTDMTELSREGYAKAGEIATEVLENIRTVQVFGQEEREVDRFAEAAQPAEAAGIKRELASSASIGVTYLVLFGSYSVAFYFSSYLIEWKRNDVGEITAVFFAVLMGSFGLGLIFPSVNAVAESRGAAHKLFAIIDRVPPIDIDFSGKIPKPLSSSIDFVDVAFSYPTRKEHALFKKLNVSIKKGTTVAFSGASGSGKSSVIQLVQRFYDPDAGTIKVDGEDLREIDLHWWRDQIGIVSQEPNLFSGSISENVRVGKADATNEEVESACRRANIHDLVMTLPQQYDTPVGSVGSQLSGGQKQRIAIARAIVKNPRILILDEATSALDRKSEVEVQAALDQVMQVDGGRLTVIVIAHRLATIRNADAIHFVTNDELSGSVIAESGTFEELMALNGYFAAMTRRQGANDSSEATPTAASPTLHTGRDVAADHEDAKDLLATDIDKKKAMEKKKADLKEAAEAEVKSKDVPYMRILKLNSANCWAVALGLLGSLLSGAVYPVYAVVLSNMLKVLGENAHDTDALRDKVPLWAGLFVVIGATSFIGWMLQAFYSVAGERLTTILRRNVFRAMLRQDQAFFDTPGRDAGALAAVLSGDTEAVHQLWGPSIGFKIQMMCNLLTGLGIGFYYSWKLTLVTVSSIPAVVITGAVQQMLLVGFGHEGGAEGATEDTVKAETFTNVRTVAAFNMQARQVAAYAMHLTEESGKQLRNAVIMGLIFGFSQFTFFGVFALAFWYGGKLIAQGELTFIDVMTCSMAVLMGAMGAGEAGGFAAKLKDAEMGAKRVFFIIDRKPTIDPEDEGDRAIGAGKDVTLKEVEFTYPARPDAKVLKKLSVDFAPNTSNGLMGTTGCGKSTIVQLLARFYEPQGGTITINGKPLPSLDLQTWRKHISIVLQEPSLFSGTVMENIRYSRPDATDEEVFEAAKLACIHDDVLTWPEQYQTDVGYKGRALSGGQKQRVAIARGLLRKPKLLLLDEATSALDNATEAKVQKGIERAQQKHPMTIVSVAHRLTTIQDADKIVVLDGGVIIEEGSHEQLMALDGEYKVRWELYQAGTQ